MNINPVKVPQIKITKRGVSRFSRITAIIFAFLLYIIGDYLNIKTSGGFITSWAYWSKLLINMTLVISIMLTVRNMRKDKRIEESFDIMDMSGQINRGFKVITINGFSSHLDNYLKTINEQNKYETFIRHIQHKLLKTKEKEVEKRKELNRLLALSKEEIVKMDFNYKKITISKLFTAVDGRIPNDNEFDIDTYEKQDVGKMIGMKALLVILFGAFTGSIVADFMLGGWTALFSSLLKIFSLIIAINSALITADEFVDHNITTSLQRRLRILAGFVNNTPDLKYKLEVKFEKKEEERA